MDVSKLAAMDKGTLLLISIVLILYILALTIKDIAKFVSSKQKEKSAPGDFHSVMQEPIAIALFSGFGPYIRIAEYCTVDSMVSMTRYLMLCYERALQFEYSQRTMIIDFRYNTMINSTAMGGIFQLCNTIIERNHIQLIILVPVDGLRNPVHKMQMDSMEKISESKSGSVKVVRMPSWEQS